MCVCFPVTMAEESKVPHWDATKFRLGVMVAVNHSKDPSVVEINPATMRDLGFEFGYVVVKVLGTRCVAWPRGQH